MSEQYIIDKSYLNDLLQHYLGSFVEFALQPNLTILASNKSNILWEIQLKLLRNQIQIVAKDNSIINRVIGCFDRIGLTELSITDVMSKKQIRTSQEDWQDQFMGMVTKADKSQIGLFPDTNFIKRRYSSGLYRRLSAEKGSKLNFGLPNLVILEIEARYNRAKKTSENEKCPEPERTKALANMREELLATQELIFLREKGAIPLDSDIGGVIPTFSKVAGDGFADAYIRSEIQTATRMVVSYEPKFLTCDLINALSAVAEGLPTLYFSRVPTGTLIFSNELAPLPNRPTISLEQIVDLILDTVLTFGELTLKTSNGSKSDTKLLKGYWDGWSIDDLLNQRLLMSNET